MDIGPSELLIVAAIVLLLFGGSSLPKLARNLGKAQKEFRSALDGANDEGPVADRAAANAD